MLHALIHDISRCQFVNKVLEHILFTRAIFPLRVDVDMILVGAVHNQSSTKWSTTTMVPLKIANMGNANLQRCHHRVVSPIFSL